MNDALTLEDPLYFDRLARFERDHWWSLGMWRLTSSWLDRVLKGRTDLTALDLGCGAGVTARRLADRPEIATVVAIDPSLPALAHACRGSLLVARGSALALPFASGSLDLVTSFDVFQHLPDGGDLTAAIEIRRVLRPGGFALIRANGRGLFPNPGTDPYRLELLVDRLETAGLNVLRATYANCLPAVGAEILGKLRPGRRGLGHPSGGGLRPRETRGRLDRIMGAVAAVEAVWVGSCAGSLPVGHSTLVLAARGKMRER